MGLILDTNFVITAERESKRQVAGHGMDVVTTNQSEFERVPGLVVIGY